MTVRHPVRVYLLGLASYRITQYDTNNDTNASILLTLCKYWLTCAASYQNWASDIVMAVPDSESDDTPDIDTLSVLLGEVVGMVAGKDSSKRLIGIRGIHAINS